MTIMGFFSDNDNPKNAWDSPYAQEQFLWDPKTFTGVIDDLIKVRPDTEQQYMWLLVTSFVARCSKSCS